MHPTLMRHFIFVTIFATQTYSQPTNWKFQNPYPDGESNYALEVVNDNVFICGLFGKIIKSTDSGASWRKPCWQTIRNFFALSFYDEKNGIAAGGYGDIFKTCNGGESWDRVYPSDLFLIEDIAYQSSNVIAAVGRRNNIILSTDTGETWTTINLQQQCYLSGLAFKNNIGLACGQKDSTGIILRSSDAGLTWEQVVSPVQSMADINFVNDTIVFAVGEQTFCQSTDAGLTWYQSPNYTIPWYLSFNAVNFADDYTGIITGNLGLILRTTDCGLTWAQIPGLNSSAYNFNWSLPDYNDVKFSSSSTGYIAGTCGTILKTTDAGLTWDTLSSGTISTLAQVQFIDKDFGVVSGGGGAVVITSDGGSNWLPKYSDPEQYFTSLKVLSKKHIVGAGQHLQNNITFLGNKILQQPKKIPAATEQDNLSICAVTFDGGNTWSTTQFKNGLLISGMDFFDNNNGLLLASERAEFVFPPSEETLSAEIYKTIDGGTTWSLLDSISVSENFNMSSLKILSDSCVLVMTEFGKFYKSTDAGLTWRYITEFPFQSSTTCMDFLDVKNGFATSMNGVYKTTNGGEEWTLIYDAAVFNVRLFSVNFYDSTFGYAVGDGVTGPNYCVIIKTTDGGVNWAYEYPPTVNPLNAVYAVSPDAAYAAGSGGTILTNLENVVNVELQPEVTPDFILFQNYPNPFNPSTIIKYAVKENSHVLIIIYDILGKEIARIVDEQKPAGNYSAKFSASGLAAGIYFYRISAGTFTETKKMILLK